MQSSLPSPIPAKSTESAWEPACFALGLAFLFPLDFTPWTGFEGSITVAVLGREGSLAPSFCQETLSKSSSMGAAKARSSAAADYKVRWAVSIRARAA